MAGKYEDKASAKEIQDFRDALDDMNYTLGKFCQIVAIVEGNENKTEEDKIVDKVKKSFNKERRIPKTRLQQYWDYLSNQPNFDKVGRVVLPNGRDYLSQSKFADQIMSAFNRDKKGSAK
ncbi:hypothetical protein [Bermanella sp. R86510]|uniref:hypothetical protein n=1 Tax=unclassified Bermanella TaxID=2627862 RepID=UPI0037CA992C